MGWFSLWFERVAPGALARTGLLAPSRFTLSMPTVEIDGEPFDIGPVMFEPFEEWGVYTCVQ
jgi:hypothetical protein